MSTQSPHDEFFKEIFGDLDRARDFLRDALPPDVRDLLDLSLLRRESESYISPELAETYADLVFSVPLADSRALVAILLEHKSWAPKYPHLQVLAYLLGIWERAAMDGTNLPLVLPLVLYNGLEKWSVTKFSQALPVYPERLRSFFPDFSFLLVNLAQTSGEDLKSAYHNRSVLVAMELMKAIFSPVEVARLMERLSPDDGPMDAELALRFLRVVLRYIFKRSDFGVQQALTLKLHPTTRELTMTMEEQILLRGEQAGLKKGH